MNILITSAGRQKFLVNCFKEAVGSTGTVFASDIDKDAPALKASDIGIISPPFTKKNYVNWLTEICQSNRIDLLITLNIDDLLVLEKNRDSLNKLGILLVGGNLKKIEQTYDKYALSLLCENIGICIPKTFLFEDIKSQSLVYPIIAKPRYGKGSRGHKLIKSSKELSENIKDLSVYSSSGSYVFQEFIEGQEYGIDIVNNFDGKYEGVLVRKKFSMKNGETYEAITESQIEWNELAKKLSAELSHQGTIDVDIIVFDGVKYVIDINHRFGGGYIFSHASGAHLPKAYVKWFQGASKLDVASKYLSYTAGVHIRRDDLHYKIIS